MRRCCCPCHIVSCSYESRHQAIRSTSQKQEAFTESPNEDPPFLGQIIICRTGVLQQKISGEHNCHWQGVIVFFLSHFAMLAYLAGWCENGYARPWV